MSIVTSRDLVCAPRAILRLRSPRLFPTFYSFLALMKSPVSDRPRPTQNSFLFQLNSGFYQFYLSLFQLLFSCLRKLS